MRRPVVSAGLGYTNPGAKGNGVGSSARLAGGRRGVRHRKILGRGLRRQGATRQRGEEFRVFGQQHPQRIGVGQPARPWSSRVLTTG